MLRPLDFVANAPGWKHSFEPVTAENTNDKNQVQVKDFKRQGRRETVLCE
jgi:hypothetical protein